MNTIIVNIVAAATAAALNTNRALCIEHVTEAFNAGEEADIRTGADSMERDEFRACVWQALQSVMSNLK